MNNVLEDNDYLLFVDTDTGDVLKGNIASPFNTLKLYRVGELCWYDGKLYRCISNMIQTGWKSDEWYETNISDWVLNVTHTVVTTTDYIYAIIDADKHLLFGIKYDGTVVYNKGMSDEVREKFETIANELNTKVDKEDGKSLINKIFADSIVILDSTEYLYAITDSNNKLLFGIKRNGDVCWYEGIPEPINDQLHNLKNLIHVIDSAKVDKEDGKSLISKLFADSVNYIQNEEYIFAIIDNDSNILFGINKDGNVTLNGLDRYISGKVDKIEGKTLIDSTFSKSVHYIQNEEYMFAVVDNENNILLGVNKNGDIVCNGIERYTQNKVDKEDGKSLIDAGIAKAFSSKFNENMYTITDNDDRLIYSIRKDSGKHTFYTPVAFDKIDWSSNNLTELEKALKENGFTGGTGDWSDKSSIDIPKPELAIVNFSNIDHIPQSKAEVMNAIVEFYSMNGNYFKKNAIIAAQGNSSMRWDKKNISMDLCNDSWIGDDTFKVKFGDWVEQDSFHLKAYYTDFFRVTGMLGYDIYSEIAKTAFNDTTWKMAENYGSEYVVGTPIPNNTIDSGATCYPLGFPCIVYLNGVFEGIYCWQIKKHRDNYYMNKSNTAHVHLDGLINNQFFMGNIDWTSFEVRNPKSLINYDGTKYDGDNPQELIDATSPVYDSTNKNHKNTAKVKQYILAFSSRMQEVAESENKKETFEKYFDIGNLTDNVIFSDIIYNIDYLKNYQWTTWDGVKWFINPYDLDTTFGQSFMGDCIHYPTTTHTCLHDNVYYPLTFLINNYSNELHSRYSFLRNSNTITANGMYRKFVKYMSVIGKNNYDAEYKRWTNVPCNTPTTFDNTNWELSLDEKGNPKIYTEGGTVWNATTTYNVGSKVYMNPAISNPNGQGWWYKFTSLTDNNINHTPITNNAMQDSIFRIRNWISKQLNNMDILYSYNGGL